MVSPPLVWMLPPEAASRELADCGCSEPLSAVDWLLACICSGTLLAVDWLLACTEELEGSALPPLGAEAVPHPVKADKSTVNPRTPVKILVFSIVHTSIFKIGMLLWEAGHILREKYGQTIPARSARGWC